MSHALGDDTWRNVYSTLAHEIVGKGYSERINRKERKKHRIVYTYIGVHVLCILD